MAASGVTERVGVASAQSTRHFEIEKWYYDYAENIEAVNIHYASTPLGEVPDWNSQRSTRFLPLVESRLRRKTLKLPLRILDPQRGELSDHYLLHHYFEIFADGDTHYSSLYTEEIITGVGNLPAPADAAPPTEKAQSDSNEQAGGGESARIPEIKPSASTSKKRVRVRKH